MAESLPSELMTGRIFLMAGVHPVDVAPQRVDLAVVRQIPIRMRPVPARERVRAETRVDQRQRALHRRMREVGIIPDHLLRHQHALVHHRLQRQARQVKILATLDLPRVADGILSSLANNIKLPLKGKIIRQLRVAADEHLPHDRLGRPRGRTQSGIVRRNRAPAQHALPFLRHKLRKYPFAFPPLRPIVRREHHPHAVFSL